MTSSLISFAKREITEVLPGMLNAHYSLPVVKEGFILHVEDSFYYKPDIDGNQDRVAVTSAEIVESLVRMHTTSQIAYSHDRHPALFCVPNVAVTPEMFKTDVNLVREKAKALAAQKRWFMALIQMADDDWVTYHHHRMVSDIQRTAAVELGLKREWLIVLEDEVEETKAGCPFCGTNLLDPSAPICPQCGQIHNPVAFKALQSKLGVTNVAKEPSKAQ